MSNESGSTTREVDEKHAALGCQSELDSGQSEENGERSGQEDTSPSSPVAQGSRVDSPAYIASPLDLPHISKDSAIIHPLTLDWAFGINTALPVFSLQDQERLIILYACGRVAVMYDHTSNSQHLLQGHSSPISCLCVSEDKQWIVTADRGRESGIIIWDSYKGIPVRTLFQCHPVAGVAAVALSKDSEYLATVGAGEVQRVCVWNWTDVSDEPLYVVDVGSEFGPQNHILFNPTDKTQLLSNSESHVLFYATDLGCLKYSVPELSDKTFSKVVGAVSQSVFLSGGAQALSATSAGNLVVWARQSDSCQPSVWTAIKLIPLQQERITVLTQTERLIVTGDIRGHIKFYDENIKLIDSYSKLNVDPIVSISFSKEEPSGHLACTDTIPFVVRNFALSTVTASVLYVSAQGSESHTLLTEHAEALEAVACHPHQPLVAMGSRSGILKIWDYERRIHVCSRIFQKDRQIQCVTYDPQGFFLAVGFVSGAVQVFDACSLQSEGEEKALHYSPDSITQLTFSKDSLYLATADAGQAVMVFRLCKEGGRQQWMFQGRHCSHYKPIQDLLFGFFLDSTKPRLLSLGQDRRLVEYDLEHSGEGHLLILSSVQIEQSAVPTCMSWHPLITTEHFLLTSSTHYKMKLFNSTTKMCRKTLLGPTYGSPVKKMIILPQTKDSDPTCSYMAYVTTEAVGVQILPLDGNPYKSTAVISHPMGVCSLACSYDGKYVFTAGVADTSVFSWEISLCALETAAALGGKDLMPFYNLLEGGRDGELFKEIENFFYYCQLRKQGIDSMETRLVSTKIPLTEVPFMMRALGFYPTEQELEDMHNEVKFSRYAETGKYVTDLDLEEFIKLYVNHRPAFGISREDLHWAFQVLGESVEKGIPTVSRQNLLDCLQARGEHMTEEELTESLSSLLGLSAEDRTDFRTLEYKGLQLENALPPEITMTTFEADILGFPGDSPGLPVESDSSSMTDIL
ncbi:cilia- and flagella-associated protein 251 [Chanos chanos]|uniref:Cilia- and flagella-associated protein 251 n=1 Tax=Chanos chanos TaxID=29144 RepID=A0A6J2UTJ1_CHACN|nr:cilia- and flagella-associated protein 251 [Chanos chanos]